jgi:hypothetical protein
MTEADRDENGEDGVVARVELGGHARVGEYPMFAGLRGSFHPENVVAAGKRLSATIIRAARSLRG